MRFLLAIFLGLILCGTASAQFKGDVLGSHDFSSSGKSPLTGPSSAACLYCHAPHSGLGGSTPLWSQTLSLQTYTPYTSTTVQNAGSQPIAGGTSSLCLSCHDGTVAVGQLVPYGTVSMTGTMSKKDVFGSDLRSSHPFSLAKPLKDSANLVASLAASQTTADPLHKVNLVNGSVECNSCHEPHMQNIDPVSLNFLVRDASSGQLCLSCHESNPRTVNGKVNQLAGWSASIHAVSVNNVAAAAKMGAYTTVAQFACSSCHVSHNANGTTGLLRGVTPPPAGVDATTMNCMNCHNGGSNLQQPIQNIYAEFAKTSGHPFPSATNTHDPNEPPVLTNRHATCADCHNAHSSNQVMTFLPPPNIRGSQNGIGGVSATDGITPVTPATKQYETCLRCHGSSTGKQSLLSYGYIQLWAANAPDPLNVIPQFAATATSSHPVLHTSSSVWDQPSLLPYMLNLDGIVSSSRTLGKTVTDSIFCTDCHNSDDNREFNGTGPSGPHGSQFSHILERRYEFSQVLATSGPGTAIQNIFVTPSLSAAGGLAGGPYALCAKCHNLSNVLSDASFKPGTTGKGGHLSHISEQGLSCSVCHTSHGMGSVAPGISGERLVNFDLKVVAANGVSPVSYRHDTNTCTLKCHNYYHNSDGTVTATPPL